MRPAALWYAAIAWRLDLEADMGRLCIFAVSPMPHPGVPPALRLLNRRLGFEENSSCSIRSGCVQRDLVRQPPIAVAGALAPASTKRSGHETLARRFDG